MCGSCEGGDEAFVSAEEVNLQKMPFPDISLVMSGFTLKKTVSK